MAETLGYNPEQENAEAYESRFGDKEALIEVMEQGSVENLGDLDSYYKIGSHNNKVELVHIDGDSYETKGSKFVTIKGGDKVVEGVFKPLSGENEEHKNEVMYGDCYEREAAAYLVSEHFDLDIVPPTIVRPIEGEVGSLQLLLPPSKYPLYKDFVESASGTEDMDKLQFSEDVQTLCVLDWILANSDRHDENYLIRTDNQMNLAENKQVIAIDNGASFNWEHFATYEQWGLYNFLTFDNRTNKSIDTPLPEKLKNKIEKGLEGSKYLQERLSGFSTIEGKELDAMWWRVKKLIEKDVFLSRANYPK